MLLAEDHPTNRKVVELILASAKIDLVSVEDGAQALNLLAVDAFDVILMDMQMPVVDELTATRNLRALEASEDRARTPVVMLTANAMAEHVAAALAAGADRHMAKPIGAADLLRAVAELAGSVDELDHAPVDLRRSGTFA